VAKKTGGTGTDERVGKDGRGGKTFPPNGRWVQREVGTKENHIKGTGGNNGNVGKKTKGAGPIIMSEKKSLKKQGRYGSLQTWELSVGVEGEG